MEGALSFGKEEAPDERLNPGPLGWHRFVTHRCDDVERDTKAMEGLNPIPHINAASANGGVREVGAYIEEF